MELLSIGEFARASGLSHKALRLYDDSGLLAPAYVDPSSGYRFYDPAQVATARLVAALRDVGMPLAQVGDVVRLPVDERADAVAAFWAQVEERTGAARDRAALLVERLSRKAGAMTNTALRASAGRDVGLVRPEQQDAVHAGPTLLAVADGLGPHGAAASAAAVEALVAALADVLTESLGDGGEAPSPDALARAVAAADAAVGRVAPSGDGAAGRPADGPASGTTLTALVTTPGGGWLLHVGDSRAYVLRDGGLLQRTRDDSLVADLVDAGRLTPEEARAHPQRAMLTQVLGVPGAKPSVRAADVRPGDRWLLCTDGLSAVVGDAVVREALRAAASPDDAVSALLDAVRAAGAPDNVAVAVGDVPGDGTGEPANQD